MKPQIIILVFALSLCGCASSYKQINPPALNYLSKSTDKSVNFEYQNNLYSGREAKYELENDIKLVAIKITNNSGKDIVIGKNVNLFYADTSKVSMIDKYDVYSILRQQSNFYILYLALTTVILNVDKGDNNNTLAPIAYVIGPGLAASNFFVSRAINRGFKRELNKYYVFTGDTIKSSTVKYGLVGIKNWKYQDLVIKVD